ncbi:pantoate--beta-alanine ligase [soil metagenome]
MIVFKTIETTQQYLASEKVAGKTVGFVPTMGALHEGHVSLVNKAKQDCEVVVVSIFVNPAQFNDPKDLAKYPVTIQADMQKLETAGVDVIFLPSVLEMYPTTESKQMDYDLGYLDTVLEAAARPGHFKGVALIVNKLLEIIKPHLLYMGQKDFQQLQVVRQLVKDFNLPVTLVSCPIVRENDGLAMSSRNVRLEGIYRKEATQLSKALDLLKERALTLPLQDAKKAALTHLNSHPLIDVVYLETVNAQTLEPLDNLADAVEVAVLLAARVGGVHLLDNIILKP